MLSRTAANLYWLSRNMERAECLARILDATSRLTSLPQAEDETTNEWDSAITTAACADLFKINYEEANEQTVTEFLAFSPYNPASIRNCLETARQNARAVRTALTVEMWDALTALGMNLRNSTARNFPVTISRGFSLSSNSLRAIRSLKQGYVLLKNFDEMQSAVSNPPASGQDDWRTKDLGNRARSHRSDRFCQHASRSASDRSST